MPKSHFDQAVDVNQDDWAVTLICVEKSHHAEIVIEKVDAENHYECWVAHIHKGKYYSYGTSKKAKKEIDIYEDIPSGRAKVKCLQMNPENVHYGGKSETWLRPKILVEKMLEDIRWKATHRETWPKFNIFGRNSFFANPYLYLAKGLRPSDFARLLANELQYSGVLSNLVSQYSSCGAALSRMKGAMHKIIMQKAEKNIKDNCFTWLREELKLAYISLPEKWNEFFIASTRQHTSPSHIPLKSVL